MTRAPRTTRAFTLMELLVAVTVISVMMLAVYRVFSAGQASWRKTESDLTALDEGRNFLANLSYELRSAQLIKPADGTASFLAGPDQLTFFTGNGVSDRSVKPGLAQTRVTYDFQRPTGLAAKEQTVTVRRTRQFYSGSQPIADAAAADILAGVRDIRLEYLSAASTPQSIRWDTLWDQKDKAPRAVRVTLTLDTPSLDKTVRRMTFGTTIPIQAYPPPPPQ